ncbi:adenosine kinase 2-like isoform X4 [Rutidosis leptorrhynchoides]|uniref:adenosine kinase 2-like isoform X4 n=1 Tax=Rutidosis leptorrhynchoides TaxID=125765 RepID=UPI003A9A614A
MYDEMSSKYTIEYIAGGATPNSIRVAQHFAMNRSLIANLSAAATNKIFTMNLSAPFICEFVKDAQEKALPYVDLFLETKPKQEHSQRFMARID